MVRSFISTGEQKEIAVRITHDECPRAPRFRSQRLSEFDAGGLILEEERLGILQRDRRREQLFVLAPRGIDDGRVDQAKVQSGAVAKHLAVKWRLAIGEGDGEAEHS